jgi:hypothetical protein
MFKNITKLTRSLHYGVFLAASLLPAHSAFANDSFEDAHDQARALLDPPVVRHVIATGTSLHLSSRVASYADAQESARALLLGHSKEGGAANSLGSQLGYSDPQANARRMILGSVKAPIVSTHLADGRH